MENIQGNLTNIKSKIIEQIDSQFEEPQKSEFINKIEEMNDDQFIEFIKQQGFLEENNQPTKQCVFCSMISGKIPTTKIGENNSAIAILEINPISEGHTLIIPKKHLSTEIKLEKEILNLSEEIIKKLTKTFNLLKIELIPVEIMGHQIINVLPIYKNETMESPRINITQKNLKEIKEKIEKSKIEEIVLPEKKEILEKIEEEINEKNTWLPKRIP